MTGKQLLTNRYLQLRIWTYDHAKNEWTYKEYGGGGPVDTMTGTAREHKQR